MLLAMTRRGLRSRALLAVLAVLLAGCCAVVVAALVPSDLEAALQSALALGGAGQTASVNPNVHHPPSRRSDRQHRPGRGHGHLGVEERLAHLQLASGQDVAVAMESAPEPPSFLAAASSYLRRSPVDGEDEDSADLGPAGGPQPPPALPPSLLPQRPAAPGPARHKTNNGLYTNEDNLDHNILDLAQQQRAAHASTRIFVEALLPSVGEPGPPQGRSWSPSASIISWTTDDTLRMALAALALCASLGASLGLVAFVRRRRTRRNDGGGQQGQGTRPAVRRESKVDAVRGVDLATTQDLLDGSEEEA